MKLKLALMLAATAVAVAPATAAAATKNGITPVSPKAGGKIAAGQRPTFKFKVEGEGAVWVHVCKSRKRDDDGRICSSASIGRGVKQGSTWTYKPKLFSYPGFWLVTPGTYYWQAFRINCEGDLDDCNQEGPIQAVKVG